MWPNIRPAALNRNGFTTRPRHSIHIPLLLFPRKVILKGATQSPHPFGITVFENHVFFTDWTKMAVMRANRFGDDNPALLYRTANRPGHVVVSHPVLQPIGENPIYRKFIIKVFSSFDLIKSTDLFFLSFSHEPLWQTQRWLSTHLCPQSPHRQWWTRLPLQVSPRL